VVTLESVQPLVKYLLLSLLARLDIRVEFTIVQANEVIVVDNATAVSVKLVKGLHD